MLKDEAVGEDVFGVWPRAGHNGIDSAAASAHGGIECSHLAEGISYGSEGGILEKDGVFEVVMDCCGPLRRVLHERLPQIDGGGTGSDAGIGLSCRDAELWFDKQEPIGAQVEVYGLEGGACVGSVAGLVDNEEGAVGSECGEPFLHLSIGEAEMEMVVAESHHEGCVGRASSQAGA